MPRGRSKSPQGRGKGRKAKNGGKGKLAGKLAKAGKRGSILAGLGIRKKKKKLSKKQRARARARRLRKKEAKLLAKSQEEQLRKAVAVGDRATCAHVLEAISEGTGVDKIRADLNCTDGHGLTPLLSACLRGYARITKRLLLMNAGPDTKADKNGSTALMWASERGHLDVVIQLRGTDALEAAKEREEAKKKENIRFAISAAKKVDKDAKKDEIDPHWTANVNRVNSFGWTALMYASLNGHRDVVQALLDEPNGAEIDTTHKSTGNTALLWAARNGHMQVVQLLLERGANVLATNKAGDMAQHLAARNGHSEATLVLEGFAQAEMDRKLAEEQNEAASAGVTPAGSRPQSRQGDGNAANLIAQDGISGEGEKLQSGAW
eukprot:g91.t1